MFATTDSPKPSDLLSTFEYQIVKEFISGSAIHQGLFNTAVRIVSDVEPQAGGEVSYPIHENLNWRLTRFGHQARTSQRAALLLNENGSCWQAKLELPLFDSKKGKLRKYESPAGAGAIAYLPPLDLETRRQIGQRYGVHVPELGSFWDWLADHPEIPILITEGGKKALAALSQGYVAIALFGHSSGYRVKDLLGHPLPPEIIPDLKRFISAQRIIFLAFDQDEIPKTRQSVSRSLSRFSRLIEATGASPMIARWDGQNGRCKGIDDLLVNAGAAALAAAVEGAQSYSEWQIWQHFDGHLTYAPDLQIQLPDLSNLLPTAVPQTGLVAIASAKGTGKTKLISRLVDGGGRSLLLGHRISLTRNLCHRLGLDYRGDLDKVMGQFITGSAYALRIGSCVDSLLALNPTQFYGCDLVIDEVVQVVRHLLTSSTCRQDGKLPALLARLRDLMRAARRVIVADADLDNATLNYLRELRGDGERVYLVRNDLQQPGYPVRFLQAPDASTIIAELQKDLLAGERIFIATDSRRGSNMLRRLLEKIEILKQRVLILNAETSGGDVERAFIENPDQELNHYDVVVASPSMATGVSIERPDHFTKVYGIFWGGSGTDADLAQSLARVRAPVPRVIWCAHRGSNFSTLTRSTNPLQLRTQLKQRTDGVAQVLRSQLREDTVKNFQTLDWQDPHFLLWSQIEAERNWSMANLRDALRVRLTREGHQLSLVDLESKPVVKELLKNIRAELRVSHAEAIVGANIIDSHTVGVLLNQENLSPEQRRELQRYVLCDFYALEPSTLTSQVVLEDNDGRRRRELVALEAQIYPGLAVSKDLQAIDRQMAWQQGLIPWDIPTAELRRRMRELVGLHDFLNPDREWTALELQPYAVQARAHAEQIKVALGFSISGKISDTQIIHQLLAQLGLKVEFRWSRSYPGQQGVKIRVYRLQRGSWHTSQTVLSRREQRRACLDNSEGGGGSPPEFICLDTIEEGGDPPPPLWKEPKESLNINVQNLGN
jgi:hypothetical protein